MTIVLGSTVVFVTTISNAYVNRDGTIRFQFGNSSGWGFDGRSPAVGSPVAIS